MPPPWSGSSRTFSALRTIAQPGRYQGLASARCCLHGVDDQVQQNLFQQLGIALNPSNLL
jgi:hypothetical protein